MTRRFLTGDIVSLREEYRPYMAVDPNERRYRIIQEGDLCVWLGRDPDLVGTRSLPRVLLGGRVVEVLDEKIFEGIDEVR